MAKYEAQLQKRWDVPSADVSSQLYDAEVKQEYILSLEDEEKEFIKEFKRVIDNKDIKDVEDIRPDIKEIGEEDPYLNMELGLNRSD